MNPENIDVYRIDGVLGEGGMGRVFRAWDEELERAVAIKVVRSEADSGAVGRERFRREARVVAALDHPSVVRIHRLLEWQGHDAIVMELVEGETLAGQIRGQRPGIPRALILGREIAQGLAAAHQRGVVHRDLKTSNIMVTREGRAKILDFGLAKRLADDDEVTVAESVTAAGAILGTFHTMAPEQALGQTVDSRADLFSLGVVLYEMLAGRSPFRGKTPKETLARVLSARHPALAEIDPEIPDELSRLVDRLLAKNPADRPSSASEVVDRLRRIAVDLGYDSGVSTDDLSNLANRPTPPESAVSRRKTRVASAEGGARSGRSGRWRWLVVGLVGLVGVVASAMVALRPDPEAASLERARQQWVAFDPVQTLDELRGLAWEEVVAPGDPNRPRETPDIVLGGRPEALLLAAEAWLELGQTARVQQAISLAGSTGLSVDQQLLVAGLEAEVAGDFGAAAESYQEVRDRSPEDPAATLRLVRAGLRIPGPGLPDRVANAIQDYVRLAPEDPLGWYLEAQVADFVGHLAVAAEAANDAVERTEGGRLEARALLVLGSALRAGGDAEAGDKAIQRAWTLFKRAGDTRGQAHASELLAFGGQNSQPETTRNHLEAALEFHTRNEDSRGQARVLGHLGALARRQGDFEAATSYSLRATESFRALRAFHEAVGSLNEVGASALQQGEPIEALRLFEEARSLAVETGHLEGLSILEINFGEALFALGRFEEARVVLADVQAVFQREGDPADQGYVESWLGRVASVSGGASTADTERFFERAVELQTEYDERELPGTLLAWARDAARRLGTSDPEEIRRLDERLVALDREAEEATALAAQSLRALRLWWTGNVAEAVAGLEDPPADDGSIEALRIRGLALALRSGDPSPVLELLDVRAGDARDRGAVVETLEVGLAAAEIAVMAGQPEAEVRLNGVVDEATANGAEGLARWARTLLTRTHR